MLYGIFLIIGLVLISRNENLKRIFWKCFLTTSILFFGFYLIADFSQFSQLSNIMGILLMAFFVSILFTFINKWEMERKEIKNKKS